MTKAEMPSCDWRMAHHPRVVQAANRVDAADVLNTPPAISFPRLACRKEGNHSGRRFIFRAGLGPPFLQIRATRAETRQCLPNCFASPCAIEMNDHPEKTQRTNCRNRFLRVQRPSSSTKTRPPAYETYVADLPQRPLKLQRILLRLGKVILRSCRHCWRQRLPKRA